MLTTIRTQKCLYHMNHNLVSFCKCSSCYLPVCEVCIRIHKNQHKMYETQPIFQNIDDVIMKVHQQTKGQLLIIQEFKEKISEIPTIIHLGSQNFKQKFIAQRQRLIALFEGLILLLQNSMIDSIRQQENSYIFQIESLQRQTDLVLSQIKQKIQSFEDSRSQTRMDTVIKYYSKDEKRIFQQHFARLQKRKMNLLQKKVEVDIGPIKDIGNLIRRILFDIKEGAYGKDTFNLWTYKQSLRRSAYSPQ